MPRISRPAFLSDLQRYGVTRFEGVAPGFGSDRVVIELGPAPEPVLVTTAPARANAAPSTSPTPEPDDEDRQRGPVDALEWVAKDHDPIEPAAEVS